MTRRFCQSLLVCIALMTANLASANDLFTYDNMLSVTQAQEAITPETTELLGERIDLNTGNLSFSHTDVSIPGNSTLPVTIGRSYKGALYNFFDSHDFGDWGLDIPHISTIAMDTDETWSGAYKNAYRLSGSWGRGQECSGHLEGEPVIRNEGQSTIEGYEYYAGISLHVPGQTSERLLIKHDGGYVKATKSNWRIRCENEASREG